jgi:hypothetical protein
MFSVRRQFSQGKNWITAFNKKIYYRITEKREDMYWKSNWIQSDCFLCLKCRLFFIKCKNIFVFLCVWMIIIISVFSFIVWYFYHRVCTNNTRGGGVLTALFPRVRSCKSRCDLESFDECVRVEIPTYDGLNLLIGNHYFPPDTKPEVITKTFAF